MSDLLSGLTRRINSFVHDRDTLEELTHLVEEAKEDGGDVADTIIELALGEETLDDADDMPDTDDETFVASDEIVDEDEEEIGEDEGNEDEDAYDADLDALEDDSDDDLLENVQLHFGESLII